MRTKTRIIIDPKIMVGKPVIAGTRIPVELVLKKLAQNTDLNQLFKEYPRLTKADVQAALDYAAKTIEAEEIYPIQ